ncbi:hypothetical protein FIBSPDRAFT_872192 [Athelia psychrophila]|uniref:Uncharacterized protein n=1 Tax=Athelia psychrophila TaxID=1759441 RepID=A0A165ZRV1_9AGAM|nr:hypothetical protein FIBSPDRAFT_872192 [Fibularhizoctonia sp. CBS 109695]
MGSKNRHEELKYRQLETNSKRCAAAEEGNLKDKCRTRYIMDTGETSYNASRLALTIRA